MLATKIQVLVADDDRASRGKLASQVARWGYDVIEAEDGTSALKVLTTTDGPSLALLDWEMPGLSGIELCRILRARRRAPYVYVIMVTGREGREHVITALTAGADDYTRKPIDPHELEVRIRAGGRIVELQSRLLETQKALERRARFDFLTDAINRETILEQIHDEMARSVRTKHPFSVVLLDLDKFKSVNDTHGHAVGDEVLKEAVKRAFDTVRPYDVVSRWGGEEFLILAPGCTLAQGSLVAERLKTALGETVFQTAAGPLKVTGSFGVASTRQGYEDVDALIEAADKALYLAKENGRNRVELADNAQGFPLISRHPVTEAAPANRTSIQPPSATCSPSGRVIISEVSNPPGSNAPVSSPPMSRPPMSRPPQPRLSNLPVFDEETLSQLQELVEGEDSSFLDELFENYLQSADESLTSIRAATDNDVARRAAHSLKGSSLNVGAAGVATVCRELENGLKIGTEDLDVPGLVELIESQLGRVRERYKSTIRDMVRG